jgi:hypothetical protein
LPVPILITVLLSLVTIFASVFAHFEALRFLSHRSHGKVALGRRTLILAMSGLIAAHMCEIALFAAAFYLAVNVFGLGSFVGSRSMMAMDYLYYASETYSSLGYGDLYPLGSIRLLASVTPVTGLLLLGWSSAFLFSLVEQGRNGTDR